MAHILVLAWLFRPIMTQRRPQSYRDHVCGVPRDQLSIRTGRPQLTAEGKGFCYSASISNMSALQTFLLVVDHDKQEAKQIAERVAQGMSVYILSVKIFTDSS